MHERSIVLKTIDCTAVIVSTLYWRSAFTIKYSSKEKRNTIIIQTCIRSASNSTSTSSGSMQLYKSSSSPCSFNCGAMSSLFDIKLLVAVGSDVTVEVAGGIGSGRPFLALFTDGLRIVDWLPMAWVVSDFDSISFC